MFNIPIHTGKELNDHFWVSFRCLVEQLRHSLLHWMYLTYSHFELRPSTGIPILFGIFSHFQPKNSYVQKRIVEYWMRHCDFKIHAYYWVKAQSTCKLSPTTFTEVFSQHKFAETLKPDPFPTIISLFTCCCFW